MGKIKRALACRVVFKTVIHSILVSNLYCDGSMKRVSRDKYLIFFLKQFLFHNGLCYFFAIMAFAYLMSSKYIYKYNPRKFSFLIFSSGKTIILDHRID